MTAEMHGGTEATPLPGAGKRANAEADPSQSSAGVPSLELGAAVVSASAAPFFSLEEIDALVHDGMARGLGYRAIATQSGAPLNRVRDRFRRVGYVIPGPRVIEASRRCMNCRKQFIYNAASEDYRMCQPCRHHARVMA